MHFFKTTFVLAALCGAAVLPAFAQGATATAVKPNGTFVDSYGTSFTFSLCGEDGTDLCGVLSTLKGASATRQNLAFVGKMVMRASQSGPNEWRGSIKAGGISAQAKVTVVSAETIKVQGCRSILCQTLTYTRS